MSSLTVGLPLARVSSDWRNLQSPAQRKHQRPQSFDGSLPYQEPSKHSSRSLSWLASARRQRAISSTIIQSGNNIKHPGLGSRHHPIMPAASTLPSARPLQVCQTVSNDTAGKRQLDASYDNAPIWPELPSSKQGRPRAIHGFQDAAASSLEQNIDINGEAQKRSLSPFSDSGVPTMTADYFEQLVVTPSVGQHEAWAESVQLLIKETSEAFHAVHRTLDDASLTSWLLDLPEASGIETAAKSSAHLIPPPTTTHHHQDQQDNATERLVLPPMNARPAIDKPLPPFPADQIIESPKATKDAKKISRPRVSQPTKSSRWTVAQFLSGARFRRVEADEMLTPEKFEEMRVKRQMKDQERTSLEGRESVDSSRSTLSQQSTASSGRSNDKKEEISPVSVSPLDDAAIHEDLALPTKPIQSGNELQQQSTTEASASTRNVGSLDTPPRNIQRYIFTKTKPRLPTIHEAASDHSDEMQERRSEDHSLHSLESGEFVYLPGTSLSAANSSFRHGRIAFQIAEIPADSDEDIDDAIDRAALQMAMQGIDVTEDLESAMSDDELAMTDDINEWWDSFGFETHGELIPDGSASPWSLTSRGSSICTTPSTMDEEETDAPMAVSLEDKYTFDGPVRFLRSHGPPRKWAPMEALVKKESSHGSRDSPKLAVLDPTLKGVGAFIRRRGARRG